MTSMFTRLRNGLVSSSPSPTISRATTPSLNEGTDTPQEQALDTYSKRFEANGNNKRSISRDPSMYTLQITAGPTKDLSTHVPIQPNSYSETKFTTKFKSGLEVKIGLRILIRDHPGTYERSDRAKRYFESEGHTEDRYSVQFSLEPVISAEAMQTDSASPGINAKTLLWGNDFDRPIRRNLPPGFGTALKFVKWAIDPGIVEDIYADEPFLFGPAFSSVNYINVLDSSRESISERENEKEEATIEEDLTSCGDRSNTSETPIPPDPSKRKKFFLNPQNREKITLKPGKIYRMDFCNGFLDFNSFSLVLPVFKLNILKYWDGQPLRYVLKHEEGGEEQIIFVLRFMLVPNAREGVGNGNEMEGDGGEETSSEEGSNVHANTEEMRIVGNEVG